MGINSAFKGLNRLTIIGSCVLSFGWFLCVGIFIRRRFGTLCTIFVGGVSMKLLTPPRRMQETISKRRHVEFRRRRITHKKEYNIQNTEKVWNQELLKNFPMCEQHEQFVVLWKTQWTRNARIARSNGAVFNDGFGKRFLLIQIDHQPDATIFQFIILTFIYSSTCFGRSPGPTRQRTQHG
jgi:hypothetical protein